MIRDILVLIRIPDPYLWLMDPGPDPDPPSDPTPSTVILKM